MSGFVKIAIDDYYSDNNWTTIINKYWMLAERVSDPRVQGWFLFDTPLATLVMVIIYLAFVMVAGPQWMANRKPFRIKNVLVGYNAGQVLLSLYMFYEYRKVPTNVTSTNALLWLNVLAIMFLTAIMHLMSGWWADYSLTCQPVDYSDSDKARRMLHLCWVYYFSKLSEFADTIFFVLRKKKSQITWLHLYHHSLTPFEAWLLVKFIAGGHGTFSNIVNNLVHVIMYSYYMMAAMGPQYQKYLWWKKHLTTLQLIQFFMVLFHSISALVYDCGYPKIIASGLILHSSIFIVLFTNFYIQAYRREKPKLKVDACNNNINNTTSNGYIANGHAKTNGHSIGHVTTNGYATANGHATMNGHAISNGHVTANGHATANGHITSNGHATMNGHAITETSITNGYANGHIAKEKVH